MNEKFVAKCFVETGGAVNCSHVIYKDENSWKKSRYQVDLLIKVLKNKIDELKDIRRHLKENKPKNVTDDTDVDIFNSGTGSISVDDASTEKLFVAFEKSKKNYLNVSHNNKNKTNKRPHKLHVSNNLQSTSIVYDKNLQISTELRTTTARSISSGKLLTSKAPTFRILLRSKGLSTKSHNYGHNRTHGKATRKNYNRENLNQTIDTNQQHNHHTHQNQPHFHDHRKNATRILHMSSTTPKPSARIATSRTTPVVSMTSGKPLTVNQRTITVLNETNKIDVISTSESTRITITDDESKKTNTIQDKLGMYIQLLH